MVGGKNNIILNRSALKNIAVSCTTYCKLRTFSYLLYRKYRPSFPSVSVRSLPRNTDRIPTENTESVSNSIILVPKLTVLTLKTKITSPGFSQNVGAPTVI